MVKIVYAVIVDEWENEIAIELSKINESTDPDCERYVIVINNQIVLSTKDQIDGLIDSLNKLREYLL